jgi:type VI secretion system protein ImpK
VKLYGLLEQQALEAGRRGGEYGASYYREAQYIMAALADEIFLNLDWDGKEFWKRNLLEFRLFGTNAAGEVFFQRLDRHLQERDPARVEMTALYHLALSLGFQGKYRGADDLAERMEHYRRQLFQMMFHKNPDLVKDQPNLFAEPYAYTLSHDTGKRIPHIRRWLGVIGVILFLFLIVSHVIWVRWTHDLGTIAQQIITESERAMKSRGTGQ